MSFVGQLFSVYNAFMRWFFFSVALVFCLILTACSQTGFVVSPSPTIPPTPSSPIPSTPIHSVLIPSSPVPPTPTLTSTASAWPTVTPRPTLTPTPTVCVGQATPQTVPTRLTPLEVRWISSSNLWLWNESSGNSWQVTEIGDVRRFSVSEDGQLIVFKRSPDPYQSFKPYTEELWAVNRDGSGLQQLLSAEQVAGFATDLSPDYIGNSLTFLSWEPGDHKLLLGVIPVINAIGAPDTPVGYWLLDADTGKLSRASPPPTIDHNLSPDGKYRYIVGDSSLSICRADGSDCRADVITYPSGPYEGGHWWYGPTLAWSPDSQSLKAVFPSPDSGETSNIGELVAYLIPLDTQLPIQSAHFEAGPYESYLSPDQQYLLFWKPVKPNSNTREMHLATFDGQRNEIYAIGNPLGIDGWAPDGMHFVYWLKYQAWLGVVCGGAVPLTDVGYAYNFTWVDDQRFVFISGSPDSDQGTLRLGKIGEASIELGPFNGQSAYYQLSP